MGRGSPARAGRRDDRPEDEGGFPGQPRMSACVARATAHIAASSSPTVLSARRLARKSPKFAKIDSP